MTATAFLRWLSARDLTLSTCRQADHRRLARRAQRTRPGHPAGFPAVVRRHRPHPPVPAACLRDPPSHPAQRARTCRPSRTCPDRSGPAVAQPRRGRHRPALRPTRQPHRPPHHRRRTPRRRPGPAPARTAPITGPGPGRRSPGRLDTEPGQHEHRDQPRLPLAVSRTTRRPTAAPRDPRGPDQPSASLPPQAGPQRSASMSLTPPPPSSPKPSATTTSPRPSSPPRQEGPGTATRLATTAADTQLPGATSRSCAGDPAPRRRPRRGQIELVPILQLKIHQPAGPSRRSAWGRPRDYPSVSAAATRCSNPFRPRRIRLP